MASSIFAPLQQILASDGSLGVGLKVFVYQAGTTTKINTYPTAADADAGTNANTNPIVLNARGDLGGVYLPAATATCKVVLALANDTDPPTSPITTRDNVPTSDAGLRADLASTDAGKGGSLVANIRTYINAKNYIDKLGVVAGMEAAFAASDGGKRAIFVPHGEYEFDDQVEMPDGLRLHGEGDDTVLIYNFTPPDTTITPLFLNPTTPTSRPYVFKELYFKGPGTVGVIPDLPTGIGGSNDNYASALALFAGAPITFEECLFTGWYYDVARIRGAASTTDPFEIIFNRNRFKWCYRGPWLKNGPRDIQYTNNFAEGLASMAVGIDDLSFGETYGPQIRRVVITGNNVKNVAKKLQTGALFTQSARSGVIADNVLEDIGDEGNTINSSAITTQSGGASSYEGLKKSENLVIADNTVWGAGTGVNLGGIYGSIVSENTIVDCWQQGVQLSTADPGNANGAESFCSRVKIRGNYIGTSDGASIGNRGVRVNSGQLDTEISGNTFYNLTTDIDDSGTRTIEFNNQSIPASGNPTFPTVDFGRMLAIKGQVLNAFRLTITNDGGTLKHRWRSGLGRDLDGTRDEWLSGINGVTSTPTATPNVDGSTGFAAGGGIQDAAKQRFIIDTIGDLNNTPVEGLGIATIVFNDTGTDILVGVAQNFSNINGTTKRRIGLEFTNPTTGAAFTLDTTNIPSGDSIIVQGIIAMPLD